MTIALYRLLPGSGQGGGFELIMRAQANDDAVLRGLMGNSSPGRYRLTCLGANGRVVPGGQIACEMDSVSRRLRRVAPRNARDYRVRGGTTAPAAARIAELEAQVAELTQKLGSHRKRRRFLLGLIDALDREATRLVAAGRTSHAVADHLEDQVGTYFKRPNATEFRRRVTVPDGVRKAIQTQPSSTPHTQ